jgi:hypothetical protein
MLCVAWTTSVAAQQSLLNPLHESGQSVTPAFEGWYKNADGTYSISFGYFNRNAKEVLDIPIGPNNFFSPGDQNRGQPTHFMTRRSWGAFAVTVPADFGQKKLVWTLVIRGQTYAIPGSLKNGWQIDALEGEAGAGNTPPVLKFDAAGPEGRGPGGITSAPMTVAAGTPLSITVWATDDGRARSSIQSAGRGNAAVTLAWFQHQGPGTVTFAPATPVVDRATGKATVTATFSAPGEYILRVLATDASGITAAGHAQCCWTNGFVKITVTR